MLFTYHNTPQVHVTVNGIAARCRGGDCPFLSHERLTPFLLSVSHTIAVDNTIILTLRGGRFSAEEDEEAATGMETRTAVWLGTREHRNYCTITYLMPDTIVCSLLNNTVAGNLPVVVHVAGRGAAVHQNGTSIASEGSARPSEFVHTYSVLPEAVSLLPESGSFGGGTVVTISGHNFGTVKSTFKINLYHAAQNLTLECDTLSVKPTELVFSTPPVNSLLRNVSWSQFRVLVQTIQTSSVKDLPSVVNSGELGVGLAFNYSMDKTPVISRITPDNGVPTDINALTIFGTFGSAPGDVEVRVGGGVVRWLRPHEAASRLNQSVV
jgi:hypothetical protein